MNFETSEQLNSIEAEKPKLAEPWEHPDRFHFEGTEVFAYDIKPEHEKTDIPVAFAQGFGGTPLMFKKDIDTLVEHERRVISVDAMHGVPHNIPEEKKRGLPDAELRKVAALLNTLDAKNIDKVDGVGNSEGSMVLVLAAALYPERFRNLVLEQPAGLIGKDTPLKLGVRFETDIIASEIKAARNKVPRSPHGITPPKKEASDLSPKNLYLALQEIRAMANTKLPELLAELKNRGIGISIIHGAQDKAFPMERMQEMVKANMIDGFYSVRGSHAEVRPEEEKKAYTELAEYALATMEKKQEKQRVESKS
ncbi:MAG: alpha/beta hydrolase [Minisyncoccia bacterium]|jgi:pimeloyl-ACP methyl ester carboxylesterase